MDSEGSSYDQNINQERVLELLKELKERKSSASVSEDILTLERALQDSLSQAHGFKNTPETRSLVSEKNSQTSTACQIPSKSTNIRKAKVKVQNVLKSNSKSNDLLKQLQTLFLPRIKSTERLIFIGQEPDEIRTWVVKSDNCEKRLIIVGPRDIKTKSKGQVHIGDQILAFDKHLLQPLSVTAEDQAQSQFDPKRCSSTLTENEQYDNSVVHDVKPYVIDDFHLAKQHSSGCVAHDATKQSLASNPQRLTETPVNICQQSSKSERWEQQEEATKPSIFSQKNSSGQVVNQNAIFKSDIENIPVVPPTSISVALTDKFVEVVETVEAERKKANAQSENHVPFIVVTLLRQSPHMVLKGDLTEVEIIHLPNIPGVGLGFGIVGGTSTGVVVKTILPGSTADKDKRLRPGDHILRIRGISVYGMSSQQVATLLRQQYTMIEIVVGRPAFTSNQSTNDTACCWTMPTHKALCPQSLEEQIQKRIVALANQTTSKPKEMKNDNYNSNELKAIASESYETIKPMEIVMVNVESKSTPEIEDGAMILTTSDTIDEEGIKLEENHYTAVSEKESELKKNHQMGISKEEENQSNAKILFQAPASPKNCNDSTKISTTLSHRQLQEMVLTTFTRANWIPKKYETIEVELCRDPVLGLGITVAGYVHEKEEINGVFVKSLVPNSSAFYSKKIQLHDLIVEVDGKSLEGLNHRDSVRTLVRSGTRVKIKLIRFLPGSQQAQCLQMLQEQEATAPVIDTQNILRDVVAHWKRHLGADFEVVSVDLIPDKCDDGGLGISLEGTVDVLNGTQLCPHHYIDSLRPGGPAAFSNALRSGDELLQANDMVLYGESHVTVRQALSKAASASQRVRLTVARKAQTVNVFMPRPEQSLPTAYPLLAASDNRMVKAKSETCLTRAFDSTASVLEQVSRRLRSRSLQLFTGLAIWKCIPMIVQLEKDSRGLGFSVVDYRDPLHPGESVIVVRSLVPGGLAQADGRIIPGDRLMFVNDEDLSNSTLEHAVSVLKSAPDGLVRLGIAKPIPIEQCSDETSDHYSPIISRSERVLAEGSSPRIHRHRYGKIDSYTSSEETVWLGATEYRRQHPQAYYPTSGSFTPSTPRAYNTSLNGSYLSMTSWSPCSTRSVSPCGSSLHLHGSWAHDVVYLPPCLERSIKIQKGALSLGLVLNVEVDKSINGCQVKSICSKKAVGRDGRVQVNDYIVKVNTESLRNVTNSQARAILKRTNLIGTHCNITYITASDAKLWKERYHQDTDSQLPVVNRLSPKVFPKFYRSPYIERKQMMGIKREGSSDSDAQSLTHSVSSTTSSSVKKSFCSFIDDTKSIQKFACDFVQAILNDVLLELTVVEHVSERTNYGSTCRDREPSLSELIETKPSTSAALPKVLRQSTLQFTSRSHQSEIFRKKDEKNESPFSDALMRHEETWQENNEHFMIPTHEANYSYLTDKISLSPVENALNLENLPLSQISRKPKEYEHKDFRQGSSVETYLINSSVATVSLEPSSPSSTLTEPIRSSRSKFWGQARTVVLHREPNHSFGISIVGGRVEVSQKGDEPGVNSTVSGIFIKSVLPNSPAGLSGMMNMGDRVISVNDQDLRRATHEQAVQVIKNAKNPVKFVLQSLHSFTPHQTNVEDNRTEETVIHSAKNKEDEGNHEFKLDGSTIDTTYESVKPTSDSAIITNSEDAHVQFLDSSTVGSFLEKKESSSALNNEWRLEDEFKGEVSEIKKEKIGEIKKENVELFKKSSLRDSNRKRHLMRRKPDPDSAAALPKRDTDLEEEDDFLYTKDKIARKYGDLPGDMILLKLDKVPCGGLGLSLAGNHDHNRMNVFVVAVRSTCPLSVKIGDELFEVNGKVLIGLTHLNASAIIRECCEDGILELLLLRRFETMAITLQSVKATDTDTELNEYYATAKELQMSGSEKNIQLSGENAQKKLPLDESVTVIETGRETVIEIDKDGKGLGLSIVGGSDTVLGTVVIHEVYPDGAAAVDGRLKPGDQVLEVNGISLRGVSHEQAILLLRRTPAKVRLLIYRDVNLQLSLLDPTQIYNIFEMELTKKPGRGLGLSIVGRKNEPGVYVSEVVKGGAADTDGRLMQGDQILAVNGQDVASSMQEDVATKLKACTGRVTLKVGRWKLTEAANKVHAATEAALSSNNRHIGRPVQPSKLHTTPEINLFEPCNENNAVVTAIDCRRSVPLPAPLSTSKSQISTCEQSQPSQVVHADLSPVIEETSSGTDQRSLLDEQEHCSMINPSQNKEVELIKDLNEENSDSLLVMLKKIPDQQLGMGIGKRARGILITSLQPGSVAAEKLKIGDRLMAVNGVTITDQLSAVTLVKASDEKLWLQLARPRNFREIR